MNKCVNKEAPDYAEASQVFESMKKIAELKTLKTFIGRLGITADPLTSVYAV